VVNFVQSLRLFGEFVLHICIASVLFILMLLVGATIHLFVSWMTTMGAPQHITYPAGFLEYLVFALDFICFVVFCLGLHVAAAYCGFCRLA
jgi:hypothetical protein